MGGARLCLSACVATPVRHVSDRVLLGPSLVVLTGASHMLQTSIAIASYAVAQWNGASPLRDTVDLEP